MAGFRLVCYGQIPIRTVVDNRSIDSGVLCPWQDGSNLNRRDHFCAEWYDVHQVNTPRGWRFDYPSLAMKSDLRYHMFCITMTYIIDRHRHHIPQSVLLSLGVKVPECDAPRDKVHYESPQI